MIWNRRCNPDTLIMTTTILFWLKLFVAGLILHTVWSIVRDWRKRIKNPNTAGNKWKELAGNIFYLLAGVFIMFLLYTRFQQPLNTVLQYKDKPAGKLIFYTVPGQREDSLQAYRGKVIILNLWATWCGPCRRELPDLNRLDSVYRNRNVKVIAISDEDNNTIQSYLLQYPMQLITGHYSGNAMLDSLSTRPVSILIDRYGNIQDVVAGARGYGFFEDWVNGLINRK